jgi:hypothetical protein
MTWHIGDRAYLVPTLPTAPTDAYHQPQVVITKLTAVRVGVELPDQRRLWTSLRNLAVRPLQPPPPRMATPPACRLVLADNEHQTALW